MTPFVVWLFACAWLGPDDLEAFEDQDGDGQPYDRDCDDADPNVLTGYPLFADKDGDGHGDPNHPTQACDVEPGTALLADDCDDADPTAHGGATERCGGGDEDCDGAADDLDPEGVLDASRWYVDADQDGYGTGEGIPSCAALAGRVALGTDCDDEDAAVHPGAPEVCGGVDADCDFRVDDGDPDTKGTNWYYDGDGDGFGDDATSKELCVAPPLYVALGTDCDDADASVSPSASEQCGGADEDCDGLVDDDDPSTYGGTTWYTDADADGFGDLSAPSVGCFPTGRVADTTDCDDARASVNPAAQEVCDAANTDEDCDGAVDDVDADATGQVRYYVDGDDDGHGAAEAIEYWCDPPADVAPVGDDCDDLRADVSPSAVEVWYDGLDQDCDFQSDDDADQDGHDDEGHGGDDCDDQVATTYPGAPEVWYDGDDSDCDGWSDLDADMDGYDSAAHGGKDCNDEDAKFNPGATEVWYDGLDQDCAGDDDYDQDHDAHRATSKGGDDCDDTVATTYLGADEFVDNVDSNCDGKDYVCGDTIRRVPLDRPTPQIAILQSCPGDTVRIDPGDWPGNFLINLNITVEGTGPGVRFVGDGTGPVVVASRSTLRNLTITGGHATTFPGGGGLKLENGSGARLENLIITGNTSDSWGGGATIIGSAFVRIEDVVVEGNTGGSGGGMMLSGCPDVRVSGSTFRDNVGGGGGGLFVSGSHRMSITDNVFESNTSSDTGGGAYFTAFDDGVLERNTFVGNTAASSAGFHVSSGKNWTMTDMDVLGNTTLGSTGGAGFTYNEGCTLEGLEVRGNTSTRYGGMSFYESNCEVRDAHIWENVGVGLNAGYTPNGFLVEDAIIDSNDGGLQYSFGTIGTLRDVSFRGNRSFALGTDVGATLEDVVVRDTINATFWAVSLPSSTVRGLTVVGSSRHAVLFTGTIDVQGLVSAGNIGAGVGFQGSAVTGSIDHASIVGNGLEGINTGAALNVSLSHVVSAWNLVGVNGYPGSATFANCNVSKNASAPSLNGVSITPCSTAEPKFQTYGYGLDPNLIDLHVRPSSPLKDAGAPAGDADGTRGDVGAYGGLLDTLDSTAWYVDGDKDTLPDGWEQQYGLDPTNDDRTADLDADGLTNLFEYQSGTLPDRADTDGDDLSDKAELDGGTDPASPYSP